jgi:Glycosyltransferase sugar-binding region containing DXD motif
MISNCSTIDDDVNAFFGVSSTSRKRNAWTANDIIVGQSIVHNYQCHTIPTLWPSLSRCFIPFEECIPAFLHFIWLGDEQLPFVNESGESACIDSWKRHHPKWMVQLWRDDDVKQQTHWYNLEALQYAIRHKYYGMASNILRLELLFEHGGLYVDVDYICIDSVEDLHRPFDFYCGASHSGAMQISNRVLASQPRHFLIRYMMERIYSWYEDFRRQSQPFVHMCSFLDPTTRSSLEKVMELTPEDVTRNTGPGLVTTCLAEVLISSSLDASRVAVMPCQVFDPVLVPNPLRRTDPGVIDEQSLEEIIAQGATKAVHLRKRS